MQTSSDTIKDSKGIAVIHCFSATGNTARAANIVNQALCAKGYKSTIVWIGGEKYDGPPADLTILAFPVYAWTLPDLVRRYLSLLPKGENRRAAILATWGGSPGRAVGQGVELMKKMGYNVTHSGGALFPENWTHVINPPTGQALTSLLESGETMMQAYVDSLFEKANDHYQSPRGTNLLLPISYGFRFLGRRVLGLTYYADSDCTGCGLCERICPVQNIKNGAGKHPKWGLRCEDCCKCINLCPARSVNSSNNRIYGALVSMVVLSALAVWQYEWIRSATLWLSGPLRVLSVIAAVHVLWFLMVYYVSNPLLLALEKKFRGKMDASYSKGYSRYKHPDYRL